MSNALRTQRIHAARRAAVVGRLGHRGMTPVDAERWIAAWEAYAAENGPGDSRRRATGRPVRSGCCRSAPEAGGSLNSHVLQGLLRLGQAAPDGDEDVRDLRVVVVRDGEHLWFMLRVVWDDHQRRRSPTLDVELDPAQPHDRHAQKGLILGGYLEPTVGEDDRCISGTGAEAQRFGIGHDADAWIGGDSGLIHVYLA
jgi:hypothetical protein